MCNFAGTERQSFTQCDYRRDGYLQSQFIDTPSCKFNMHNATTLRLEKTESSLRCCSSRMQAGVEIAAPKVETFNGQEVEVWPRIVWTPEWGLTCSDIKNKLRGICSVSQKSTLVLDGKHIILDSVTLNGTLVVTAVENAKVTFYPQKALILCVNGRTRPCLVT